MKRYRFKPVQPSSNRAKVRRQQKDGESCLDLLQELHACMCDCNIEMDGSRHKIHSGVALTVGLIKWVSMRMTSEISYRANIGMGS